jgi:hypothetical protein
MAGPNLQMVLIAEYNEVLGEEPKELHHYLKGISRNSILQAGAYFLGFKSHKSIYQNYRQLIKMFFRPENAEFSSKMLNGLNELRDKSQAQVIVINPASSLNLFQYAFENLNDEEIQSKTEVEQNIFLAYLALNQFATQKQSLAFSSSKIASPAMQLAAMFFAQSYPYSDIINYDEAQLFTGQLIKAILLFEYLESNAKTNPLFKAFLKYYKCESWKEYLHKLLPIVIAVINKEREAHIDLDVSPGKNFDEDCEFIDKLSVDDNEGIEDYDFKKLRDRPLYKVSPGLYRIIYGLFVIEKVFKGLYFKLAEINKTLPANEKIKDLHSLYSDEFSERTLLYKILEGIYQRRYIEFNGQQMKDVGLDAEPDFYLRKGNVIFLFESKDFLIKAETKTSYDYALLEEAFRKKLYFDSGAKAVLQLIKNIKRVLEKALVVDTGYNINSVYIYPIIVVHDHQYDVVGLNKIVSDWFREEVEKLKTAGFKTDRIQMPIILDIDTLIFIQDLLRDRTLKLEELADAFHRHITLDPKRKYRDQEHANEYLKRTIIPFGKFVHNLVIANKMQRIPKMLKEKGFTLFT